jgi:hypothetical protein
LNNKEDDNNNNKELAYIITEPKYVNPLVDAFESGKTLQIKQVGDTIKIFTG